MSLSSSSNAVSNVVVVLSTISKSTGYGIRFQTNSREHL